MIKCPDCGADTVPGFAKNYCKAECDKQHEVPVNGPAKIIATDNKYLPFDGNFAPRYGHPKHLGEAVVIGSYHDAEVRSCFVTVAISPTLEHPTTEVRVVEVPDTHQTRFAAGAIVDAYEIERAGGKSSMRLVPRLTIPCASGGVLAVKAKAQPCVITVTGTLAYPPSLAFADKAAAVVAEHVRPFGEFVKVVEVRTGRLSSSVPSTANPPTSDQDRRYFQLDTDHGTPEQAAWRAFHDHLGDDGAGWFLEDIRHAALAAAYGMPGRRFAAMMHQDDVDGFDPKRPRSQIACEYDEAAAKLVGFVP